MSFDYVANATGPKTPYTPPAKAVYCKAFRVDLSVTNATTAVANELCTLLQGSQIVDAKVVCSTAVSGPTVSAATLAVSVPVLGNFVSGLNVFSSAISNANAATYFNAIATGVGSSDVKVQYTLTLTGGTTATAGIIYITVFYVQ